MAPDDHQLERIFNEALERGTPGERTAYLDGACGGDLHLRARVDVLLRAHAEAEGFLEESVANRDEAAISEGPGSIIGNFKLLQKIGEGGMGAVYMAEQQRPVQRKVALKIIKLGMDTKQVIARFEAERQALAMMDHPGIAKVLDAGATETGRPYFVMELVRGVPIGEYCDTHNLSTRERLELFIEVCHALQHAHQKGIIHRDIKPSNVLVTSHDGRPVPKIIDFGVAKATNQRLTEMTLFTEYHQFIGTPEYMSPEQAEMSGLDIDTRSDVYSLGVLLYHLLTGTTPVDAQTLREAGYENMQRIIREQEATAPSTLISKMGDRSTDIARRRGTEPRNLQSLFRGDLDWIVMKALEKDRTRRYETVSAMADDVRRHLKNEPVTAGRPSAIYKLGKFVRRNRVTVLAGSVASAALLVGLAAAVTGFWHAREEARRSQMISDTLQDLLVSVDPGQAASMAVDVESVLQRAREAFGDAHATVAATLNSLAVQLHNSGDFASAEPLYLESIRIWEGIHGREHLNVALTLGKLGAVQRSRGDVEGAEATLREALSILEGLPREPEVASCSIRLELAQLLDGQGEREEAARLYRQAVDIYSSKSDTNRYLLIQTLEQYLNVLLNGQNQDEVLSVLQRIYEEVRLAYSDGSVYHTASAVGLGNWYYQIGDEERAVKHLREALETADSDTSSAHVYRMMALDRLFQIMRKRTDPAGMAEADELLAQCIAMFGDHWSPRERIVNVAHLAGRKRDRGLYAQALEPAREALRIAREANAERRALDELTGPIAIDAVHVAMVPDRDPRDYEAGRSVAEELLTERPDDPALAVALAANTFRLGQLEEAAELFSGIDSGIDSGAEPRLRDVGPAKAGLHALTLHALGDTDFAGVYLAEMTRTHDGPHELNESLVRKLLAEVRDTLDRRD